MRTAETDFPKAFADRRSAGQALARVLAKKQLAAPRDCVEALAGEVDEVVCLAMPDPFFAIGVHYLDFHQMSDAEVVHLLSEPRPPD